MPLKKETKSNQKLIFVNNATETAKESQKMSVDEEFERINYQFLASAYARFEIATGQTVVAESEREFCL